MNIDEMQAGPELDWIEAERVMGWTIKEHPGGRGHPRMWMAEKGKGYLSGWTADDGPVACEASLPFGVFRPSVDIAAAWVVWQSIIDRMWRKMEFMWRFFPRSEAGGGVRIMCYIGGGAAFCELGSETASWNVEAETAPLAICRAALKAVGVDKP